MRFWPRAPCASDLPVVVVQGSTPEAFGTFMSHEFERWNAVRDAAGIEQR